MIEKESLVEEFEENNEFVHKGNGWDYAAKRSVNAVNAAKEGKYPEKEWHKMHKQEILEFINAKIIKIGGAKAVSFDVKNLKKVQKEALLQLFLDYAKEYHHVDKWENGRLWRHQVIYFYEISEAKLLTVTDEIISKKIASIRANNIAERLDRQSRKTEELQIRLTEPLEIGVLNERDYFKKWLSTYTTFVGVIDGDKLYYYYFPRFQKDISDEKRNLDKIKICWKKWKDDGERFKTFAAFIKKYPHYKNKREEIERLLRIRNADRKKNRI